MSKSKRARFDLDNDLFWIECGVDLKNRKIMLDESVDEGSVGWLIRSLDTMANADQTEAIKIYLSTYGGSCYDGFALYDAIVNCPAPVHIYAMGKVMSMGTIIILAADKAFAYRNTTFMWHTIASDKDYGKMFEHITDTEELKRLWGVMTDVYGTASTEKSSWWKRWLKYEDRYGDSEKAKELGFIDEIIG